MNLFLKLGEVFINKINNNPEIELNTFELNEILDEREKVFKEHELTDKEKIEKMLEDNENCILVTEQKIKNIVFSIQTIQAEKKIIEAYCWRQ